MQAPEVELPAGEARCLPRGHCAQATVCARWLARPQPGVPLGDFSTAMLFRQGACPKFLRASEYRKQPAAAVPTVHEAPQGLR